VEGGRRRIDLMTTTSTARAPKLTKKELEKYRRLLEEKKTSLSAELAKARDAEEETTEESTQDIADKAVSSYTREFLYSLSDGDRTTLLHIDEALDRIDEGTYGMCVNCSTPMLEKRLMAVPWTPFCIDCQELAEKGMLEN
jgi:DnaK suppressor protein